MKMVGDDDVRRLSTEFDNKCQSKHDLGVEKYGEMTWLKVDTLEHAMDEVIDLANYARMTYIRLRMLQEGIRNFTADGETSPALPGKEMLGK